MEEVEARAADMLIRCREVREAKEESQRDAGAGLGEALGVYIPMNVIWFEYNLFILQDVCYLAWTKTSMGWV